MVLRWGWRGAYRGMGFMTLWVTLPLGLTFFRSAFCHPHRSIQNARSLTSTTTQPQTKHRDAPEKYGLKPDGAKPDSSGFGNGFDDGEDGAVETGSAIGGGGGDDGDGDGKSGGDGGDDEEMVTCTAQVWW